MNETQTLFRYSTVLYSVSMKATEIPSSSLCVCVRLPCVRACVRAYVCTCVCVHLAGVQEMLNHCFDDVERFMGRLQQTAEAQGILNQRRKQKKSSKKSRKSKKGAQDGEAMVTTSKSKSKCFICHTYITTQGRSVQ